MRITKQEARYIRAMRRRADYSLADSTIVWAGAGAIVIEKRGLYYALKVQDIRNPDTGNFSFESLDEATEAAARA